MENFKHILFDEVYSFGNVNSTVSKSLKMIKEEQVNGNFLVVSNIQTSGHGRNKKGWYSPDGGVYMSANFLGLMVSSNLTLFVGICLHRAILNCFPELQQDLKIKWPNDIYLENKKLCGILSHNYSKQRYHSIGIGINTNIDEFPLELQDLATSLSNTLHFQINNKKLIKIFFDTFSADFPTYIENGIDYKYFNQHSFLAGKKIVLDTDFAQYTGSCRGINKKGAVLITLKSGMVQPFYVGSIIAWE